MGEGDVPVFQGSFTDLLSDAIPAFDMSMNWNTQASWSGYSSAASHQTQTQPMLFAPYQLPLFNFGGQAGPMGYFDAGSGATTH